MKVRGADILMRSLLREGVTTLFGYPGGAIMPVFDALYDYSDRLNHVLMRHEQGAVHAAEGYARACGEVGVCLVTSGPGATNTVTGIADAMLDSTPIVVIAGQVGAGLLGTDAFQECDIVGVTQPISKWAYQIRSAGDITRAVRQAFYIAGSGRRGPVVLDFTKNAQTEEAEYEEVGVGYMRGYEAVPRTEEGSVEKAAEMINAAERPLVLIGQGVELGGAQDEVRELLERADMPAGCTLLGLSCLPTGHRLNKGMIGMHGSLATNKKTQECDLLVGIGMRFDDRITGNTDTYAKQAKKIHFDIDPSEINKNVEVDLAVLGDCKETLAKLLPLIEKREHEEWIESFDGYAKEEREKIIDAEVHPDNGPIKMGEVVDCVAKAGKEQAIVVTDVGQNQMMAARYSRFKLGRSLITSGGMGTMGFGLPAAIGATFGQRERPVCLFVGDGGLQMTLQELGTIMEQQSPVKIILLNNSYLGNVRQWQELFFDRRYSFTHMLSPDYRKIAAAYRLPYAFVTERGDLSAAVEGMLSHEGPYFLEVAVMEEDNVLPMCCPGCDVDDMILEIP